MLTPLEFAKLEDDTRWTDLQRDDSWEKKIRNQTISWHGFLVGVWQNSERLLVIVQVRLDVKILYLNFTVPLAERERYLTFPPLAEVEVSGRFTESRHQKVPKVEGSELVAGRITYST